GNYLLNQREYNPTTATFLTPDQAGSPNPYAYTSGNPLKSTDLQGLSDVDGTLTDVSHISGYASTGALAVAITCTFVRACAPAIPIAMQFSAATGVLSAGTAGILDSQACVLKGNCSALAADIAVGAVASRFPALGRARSGALEQAARLGPDSARNNATRAGLLTQARRAEAASITTDAGYLKAEVIDASDRIIDGEDLGNPAVIRALTADGSDIADWGKYSTKTYRSPSGPFQVHFYYNSVTGRMNYDIDYKSKLNLGR
ncbi:RHS repeat-associated core domain-containing protein, partial [Kribbella albertanoniae]